MEEGQTPLLFLGRSPMLLTRSSTIPVEALGGDRICQIPSERRSSTYEPAPSVRLPL